ncbi:hypothetical protein JCM25156A_01970 [Komagataeibacter kakiaceti JCM 25156]
MVDHELSLKLLSLCPDGLTAPDMSYASATVPGGRPLAPRACPGSLAATYGVGIPFAPYGRALRFTSA